MSNLRFLSEHSATSVSTFSVTDVFTSDFDIFKIVVTDIDQSSSGGSHVNAKFINSSGSVITGANYDYSRQQLRAYGSFLEDRGVNQGVFRLLGQITGNSAIGTGAVIYIFNPTNTNSHTLAIGENVGFYETAGLLGGKGIACLTELNSITGLQFSLQNSGTTFDSIKFKIYGIRVDT
jgi:hypothetical protein|tara:strand:+ start:252 stop:785 length:534 start_codon:yes stop_codon:yes gene_type:complete